MVLFPDHGHPFFVSVFFLSYRASVCFLNTCLFIPFIAVSITVVICFYLFRLDFISEKTLYVLISDQFTNVNKLYFIPYRT
jgi:hypothetical protein